MKLTKEEMDNKIIQEAFEMAWTKLGEHNDNKTCRPFTEAGDRAKENLIKALREYRKILVKKD